MTVSCRNQSANQTREIEAGLDKGVSGAFTGKINDVIFQAGGCNFPVDPLGAGSSKVFYEGIYQVQPIAGGSILKRIGSLPYPTAYGVAVNTPMGVVLVGGTDDKGTAKHDVNLVRLDADGNVQLSALPVLPVTLDNMAGAFADGKVYVAGGNANGVPSNNLYALDIDNLEDGWKELAPFPGNPRVQPVVAASCDAEGKTNLYMWGGFAGRHDGKEPSLELDGFRYEVVSGEWFPVAGPTDRNGESVATGGGIAVTLPDGRIIETGGVNKDIFLSALQNQPADYLLHPIEWYHFNPNIFVFDPTTETWTVAEVTSQTARAGAGMQVIGDNQIMVMGGELKPRIRTAEVFRATIK